MKDQNQWLFEPPFVTKVSRVFRTTSQNEDIRDFAEDKRPKMLPQSGTTRQQPTFNWKLTPNNDAGMGHLDYRHAPWSREKNSSKFTQDAWINLRQLVREAVEKGSIGLVKEDKHKKPQAGVVYDHRFPNQIGWSADGKKQLFHIRVVVDANNHVTTTFPFHKK